MSSEDDAPTACARRTRIKSMRTCSPSSRPEPSICPKYPPEIRKPTSAGEIVQSATNTGSTKAIARQSKPSQKCARPAIAIIAHAPARERQSLNQGPDRFFRNLVARKIPEVPILVLRASPTCYNVMITRRCMPDRASATDRCYSRSPASAQAPTRTTPAKGRNETMEIKRSGSQDARTAWQTHSLDVEWIEEVGDKPPRR